MMLLKNKRKLLRAAIENVSVVVNNPQTSQALAHSLLERAVDQLLRLERALLKEVDT